MWRGVCLWTFLFLASFFVGGAAFEGAVSEPRGWWSAPCGLVAFALVFVTGFVSAYGFLWFCDKTGYVPESTRSILDGKEKWLS